MQTYAKKTNPLLPITQNIVSPTADTAVASKRNRSANIRPSTRLPLSAVHEASNYRRKTTRLCRQKLLHPS
ncbi:MAG: hypothetical protein LBH04_03675 [Tannerellaceae bacterium]|nr:hypothetical protein [Tannerellaceae bacterium]